MAKYPPTPAGRRITADLLQSMLAEEIVKTVTTERASTITLADDPDLTVELEANAVYKVEFLLYFAAVQAADVKTEWTVPSGAAGLKSVIGPSSGATTQSSADPSAVRVGVHQFDTDIVYAGVRDGNTLAFRVVEEAVVTTAAAGTCAIRWCQNASSATATALFAGSVLRVRWIG